MRVPSPHNGEALAITDQRVCRASAGAPTATSTSCGGLVSDMDVVHAAYRGELATPAGELAATTPIALPEDAMLERAATLMTDHDASHTVAVGRSGLPSGVVSTLDVIRILAAGLNRE